MADWPEGVGRRLYPSLPSTNTEALRLAMSGEATPFWVLALEQTAGRGRRGNDWQDVAGNFSATLAMRPDGPPAGAALRSFIAALALRDALIAVCGREDMFTLKWPNDVLAKGRKIAGILLESRNDTLCIGIGVNLKSAPQVPDAAFAPVSLQELTGIAAAPESFLTELAAAFAVREAEFTTYGFAPIRTAWLSHAARLGETITARMANRIEIGVFETIDESGAIVLKTAKGRLALPAAEIFFEG